MARVPNTQHKYSTQLIYRSAISNPTIQKTFLKTWPKIPKFSQITLYTLTSSINIKLELDMY